MNLKTLQFVEALNQPYPYTWKKQGFPLSDATFETDSGDKIKVAFEPGYNNDRNIVDVELSFAIMNPQIPGVYSIGKSGRGDAFRIFATVIDITKEYVNKYKSKFDVLYFTGDKGPRHGTSRVKLYTKLIKKFVIPGWDVVIDNEPKSHSMFKIVKK